MSRIHTALVMAAQRAPGENRLAEIEAVSHKCLVRVGGTPMIQRVVDCLAGAQWIGRIAVSIDEAEVLRRVPAIADRLADGSVQTVASRDNIFASVEHADEILGEAAWPMVITTGDNAAHTPEMIDHFCTEMARLEADVAFAVTRRETFRAGHPDIDYTGFHRLADDEYASCNLYGLANQSGLAAATVMKTGGQFKRNKLRVLRAFGVRAFLEYRFGLASLEQVERRASRRFGLRIRAVDMPFADAPIDVDKPKNHAQVEMILARRGA